MKILLDTCILLWTLENSKKLSKDARKYIENASEIYVSAVSIWEIVIKSQIGKLEIDLALCMDAIKENSFIELPLKTEHILSLQKLPMLHKDPFDRILVAQAVSEPLKFLTSDEKIKKYNSTTKVIL